MTKFLDVPTVGFSDPATPLHHLVYQMLFNEHALHDHGFGADIFHLLQCEGLTNIGLSAGRNPYHSRSAGRMELAWQCFGELT